MTPLVFEALWRDRGALQGLGNLGKEAVKTSGRFAGLKKDLHQLGGFAGKFARGVDKDFGSVDRRLGAFVGNVGKLGGGIAKFAGVGAVALGAVGVGAVALGTKVVNSAGKFDKSMRMVGAITGQTGKGFKGLTNLALDMGAKTSFSAQGASDAMLELAKGGLTAAQIKAGALQHTLTLATAGGLELGDAASYMVSGLTAFNLKAEDAGRVASALAGGANASTASVQDMGLAFSMASASASAAGLTIEDTAAAIAALANNGIRGSDAGTSLKTMLSSLQPTSEKTADAMAELGLITKDGTNQFFNAKGEIKSMAEISGILADATKNLTNQEKTRLLRIAFGSDAQRAAIILAKEGEAGLVKYAKATGDQAAAENLAKTATEGYAGALERFKGSVETAGIQLGTKFLPPLTRILDYLSNRGIPALTRFGSDMMPAFRAGGEAIAAFWRIGRPALGAFVSAITGGREGVKGFAEYISTNQASIVGTFVRWAKGAIEFGKGLTTVLSVGLRGFAGFADGVNGFTMNFIDHMGSVLDSATTAFGWMPGLGPKLKIAQANFAVFAQNARSNMGKTGDAARGIADSLDNNLRPALDAAGRKLDEVSRKEIVKAAARDAVNRASHAIRDLGTRTDGTQIKIKKFADITNLGAREQRAFRQRLQEARQRMLEQREAGIKAGDSQRALTTRWNQGKDALYREFKQMGLTNKEARTLAERYGKIPGKVKTKHEQPGLRKGIGDTGLLDTRINALNNKKVTISYATNAGTFANAFGIKMNFSAGTKRFGGSRAQVGNQAGPDAPVTFSHGHGPESGGPGVTRTISTPVHGRPAMPQFNTLTDRLGKNLGKNLGVGLGKRLDAARDAAASAPGDPGGKIGTVPRNRAAVMAAMRARGARSFTTYPGHHPSMDRARDVTPHNWAIANAARASSSVWYVIYQMRIASKTKDNTWRPFQTSSRRGDWQHRRHVHVAFYGQGTRSARGGLAVVGERGPELVRFRGGEKVTPVRRSASGSGGDTYITINVPNGFIGNQDHLREAMLQMVRSNRYEVFRR